MVRVLKTLAAITLVVVRQRVVKLAAPDLIVLRQHRVTRQNVGKYWVYVVGHDSSFGVHNSA